MNNISSLPHTSVLFTMFYLELFSVTHDSEYDFYTVSLKVELLHDMIAGGCTGNLMWPGSVW